MRKPITCHSRDAREYCASRAIDGSASTFYHEPPEGVLESVFKKILENEETWQLSDTTPVRVSSRVSWFSEKRGIQMGAGSDFWLYKNRLYSELEGLDYSVDQKKLLVREEFDKERRRFEKLEVKFSNAANSSTSRSKIPSDVRIFVWQRDSGRCVECGSNENLEYDHIIPFAKGGSNTERNLQLLCGNCNRLKSDNIQ